MLLNLLKPNFSSPRSSRQSSLERFGTQRKPNFESLEYRRLLALNPTALEQEMLEHLNRMRMDPQGELQVIFSSLNPLQSSDSAINHAVDFFNVDSATLQSQWSQLEPTAPLAWHAALNDAARSHSAEMIAHDSQSHQFPGEDPFWERMTHAGYTWSNAAENVYAYSQTIFFGHAGFAVDWGYGTGGLQNPAGHRNNMMNSSFQEVGISVLSESDYTTQVGPLVITQDFGRRRDYGANVLGVVYGDTNGNGRYDAGEGRSNVTIQVSGSNGTYTTSTMTAGGYQVQPAAGSYTVTASGGGLSGPVVMGSITVGTDNVKVDLNTLDEPSTTGSLAGVAYHDTNRDGTRDVGESGVAGSTVYLDANDNGRIDSGESRVTTGSGGNFSFGSLTPGVYVVRQVRPLGWASTSPANGRLVVNLSSNEAANVSLGSAHLFNASGSVVTVLGTDANDSISVNANGGTNPSIVVSGITISPVGTFSTVIVEAKGGDDTVQVNGSSGDDVARLYPGHGRVELPSVTVELRDSESIRVTNSAGYDRAYFYDSLGNDQFTANPQSAQLAGEVFDNQVQGFDRAYAFATAGGVDRADMYDSVDRDFFASAPDYGRLSGANFYSYAGSFEQVHAHATAGGHDRAFFHDSSQNDVLTATPTTTRLTGNAFDNSAHSFDRTYAYATAGGHDVARLYDSQNDDYFAGNTQFARLSGALYYNQAENFDIVIGNATGGIDRAYLYDTSGNDTYSADDSGVRMFGGNIDHRVSAFDRVYGFASAGNDIAQFTELNSNALVVGSGTAANVFGPVRDQRALGFAVVQAYANQGQNPNTQISAVDYVYEQYGW